MEFLNPMFLGLGLGALAVPVVIHLMLRKRSRVIPFSTLRFLIAVDHRLSRRNRLKEILLLALRMAALALIALALAHPQSPDARLPGARPARAQVIIVDDSASMNRRAHARSSFETAIEAAALLMGALGPGDQGALMRVSDARSGSESALTSDRQALFSNLEAMKPGHFGSNPKEAFNAAVACLAESPLPCKDLIFITDLPEKHWERLFKQIGTTAMAALEDGSIRVILLVPDSPEGVNLTVRDVTVSPVPGKGPDTCRIGVVLENHENQSREGRLALTVDQDRIENRMFTLAPLSTEEINFDVMFRNPGTHRGTAELDPDILADDNTRFFLFETRAARRVLLVSREEGLNPYDDPAFYIARALAPPIRAEGSDPVQVDQSGEAALAATRLENYDVIILVNPGLRFPGTKKALEAFVQRGGGLLIFAGSSRHDPEDLQALGTLMPSESWDLQAGISESERFKLEPVALEHPLLAALRATHPPAELESPRFKGYVRPHFDGTPGVAGLRTLMQFVSHPSGEGRDSAGDPALVEHSIGDGRILAFLNDCAPASSDFAMKVSFVPFLHGAVAYLCDRAGQRVERLVGDFLSTKPAQRLNQPGFFPLTTSQDFDADRTEKATAWLAVNVDPDEGNPARYSLDRANEYLENLPHGLAAIFEDPEEAVDLSAGEEEAGSDLFYPLLFIALLLLLVEPFLANRRVLKRKEITGQPAAAAPFMREVAR